MKHWLDIKRKNIITISCRPIISCYINENISVNIELASAKRRAGERLAEFVRNITFRHPRYKSVRENFIYSRSLQKYVAMYVKKSNLPLHNNVLPVTHEVFISSRFWRISLISWKYVSSSLHILWGWNNQQVLPVSKRLTRPTPSASLASLLAAANNTPVFGWKLEHVKHSTLHLVLYVTRFSSNSKNLEKNVSLSLLWQSMNHEQIIVHNFSTKTRL